MILRSLITSRVEALESRALFAAVLPSDHEQYMLELLNRARANPAAEAARFGIDLNEGLAPGTISNAAKQPLAMNPNLVDAARLHGQWMIANDTFSHTGSGGSNPGQRMVTAGYGAANTFGWGENLAYRGQKPSTPAPTPTVATEHQDLFVDEGIDGRGHRTNMMAADFKEVGIGVATGEYQTYNALMSVQDFGYKSGNSFLTGVAFDDSVTADDFYTPGEGLDGVTITAVRTSTGDTFTTTTWSTGGYALALPAGAYNVTASGGELGTTSALGQITIGSINVKQDVRAGTTVPPTPSPVSPPAGPPVSPPPASPPPPAGIIRSSVWNDFNGDGRRQRSEPALPDRVFFLDADLDGALDIDEPQTTSGADGAFAFTGLEPGLYRLQIQSDAGWRVTSKGDGGRDVAVASRKPPTVKPFGLSTTVVIGGIAYNDVNADGQYDAGEIPFKKGTVFIDFNADGIRQTNEPATKLKPDGSFQFKGLEPGLYTLAMKVGRRFTVTDPSDNRVTLDASLPAIELLTARFGAAAFPL